MNINIMEVCGTHTMAIAQFGLKKLLPENVNLLSGPGCPVCVTPIEDIDRAIAIGKLPGVIITTFGDMLHVPGSRSSLEKERAAGADVRMVYSPVDALDIAAKNPAKQVVFPGVGFETTSPAIAATILMAQTKKIKNFSVLPMFKTVPVALRAILSMKKHNIHGFILPGHVSAIIGAKPYTFIASEFGVPGVIAGFEARDILKSIEMLLEQIRQNKPRIEIQYTSAVTPRGNISAQNIIKKVFTPSDSTWRAIGVIPQSGLAFRRSFDGFNALKKFPVPVPRAREPKGCDCGKILMGLAAPEKCRMFGTACTPAHPVGPCMVSSEGACAAAYKYDK